MTLHFRPKPVATCATILLAQAIQNFLFDVAAIVTRSQGKFCDKVAKTMLPNIHRIELFATC